MKNFFFSFCVCFHSCWFHTVKVATNIQKRQGKVILKKSWKVAASYPLSLSGCMGCPERDNTFDFRWQHPSGWMGVLVLIWHSTLANGSETFSQSHPGNWFCWWAKLSEGLVRFLLPVLGDLEREWAPPSFERTGWRHNEATACQIGWGPDQQRSCTPL